MRATSGGDELTRLLYVDAKTFLPCLNLTYTDKMSMAASVEVRVPLLDDELVALARRIPSHLKLRGWRRKYVFKKSQEGRLPRDIIWRRKAGFGAPVRSWLRKDLKPLVDDLLEPGCDQRRGLLDPREVQRIMSQTESGAADFTMRIYAILTLELWCSRRFSTARGLSRSSRRRGHFPGALSIRPPDALKVHQGARVPGTSVLASTGYEAFGSAQ